MYVSESRSKKLAVLTDEKGTSFLFLSFFFIGKTSDWIIAKIILDGTGSQGGASRLTGGR